MKTNDLSSTETSLRSRIHRFFYAEEVPYGPAVVRIFLPLALLAAMGPRWIHTRELFSLDGATTPLWYGYGYTTLLPELPATVAIAMHSILILCLVASSIGWCTRFSLATSFVIFIHLNLLDSVSTITKYSVIAAHVLLLLSFSRCGSVWSVDAWLKRGSRKNVWPGEPSIDWPKSPVWPCRLIQLLIGFVYFGAAVTKMHTPTFFTGDQLLSWMISNINFYNPMGDVLAMFPFVVVIFAYVVIVWEIMFIFTAWKGWGRIIMLGTGMMFHIMTTLTLGLYIFPCVCISIYFAYLNEQDVQKAARLFRRMGRKFSGMKTLAIRIRQSIPTVKIPDAARFSSPAVFGFLVAFVGVAGIEVEYQIDPYSERGPDGPLELIELDPAYAKTLLTPSSPIRTQDKFFSFDVGSALVGGYLLNRRTEFTQGETITAQCFLVPPHEDMWVECCLHDSKDRVLDDFGQIVTREMSRSYFQFLLIDSLEPGEYQMVLKCAGKEISRRRFTLRPGMKSPVAN